jgi:hypothetical protein
MSDEPQAPAELIRRLPATFAPALNDQFRQWNLLFPAEQRQIRAQLAWLSRLPPDQFDHLFAHLLDIERRMDLPHWDPKTAGLSVRDSGILARSPLYPQWRAEVERVFARIDESAIPSGGLESLPRLVVCILPPGIPLTDQPLWPDLEKRGAWLALDRRFGEVLPALVPAITGRVCPASLEPVERTWVFESGARLSGIAGAEALSWDSLGLLRREFLRRLNAVQRDLRSVDQTNENLKHADINRLVEPEIAANPRLREFVRTLFLSGNGSLVFGNSFVQWGASEALRRAQPQVLIASFGIRKKLKPFSSLVLFEDQSRSNPVPDEDDPAGSLVDAAMLSQYVYLGARRVACYAGHSVTLMAAFDSSRVLVLLPQDPSFPDLSKAGKDLISFALGWLTPAA